MTEPQEGLHIVTDLLLALTVGLIVIVLILQAVILLSRKAGSDSAPLRETLLGMERAQERTERSMKEEIERSRRQATSDSRESREEQAKTLDRFGSLLDKQLSELTLRTEERLEKIRETVYSQLNTLQKENQKSLDAMRQTVDEKLEQTLHQRLSDSFKLISERLEKVHRGLGEMQDLASGVGDLKRMLTNVKTRGTWGEIQLGSLLEQSLAPDQFEKNVAVTGTKERVEFAICLPGQDDSQQSVYLPIDAKFPVEDYQRLVDAHQRADLEAVEASSKQLEKQIRLSAASIRDKYLSPPKTTDFGIMFLPIEGLYAEVVQRPGLVERLQREYRVVVAGPTTLTALLNSLQMGFRTLAIQQRSSEVWQILGAVKTEFGKFGDALSKVQKKLREASNSIDAAEVRTRAISRKLSAVEEFSREGSTLQLGNDLLDQDS